MMSHSNGHANYTMDHGEVKLPSPGLSRDEGQSLRAARCAACCALFQRAMLVVQW